MRIKFQRPDSVIPSAIPRFDKITGPYDVVRWYSNDLKLNITHIFIIFMDFLHDRALYRAAYERWRDWRLAGSRTLGAGSVWLSVQSLWLHQTGHQTPGT